MKKVITFILFSIIIISFIACEKSGVHEARQSLKQSKKISEAIITGEYEKAKQMTLKYFESDPEKTERYIYIISVVEMSGGIAFCDEKTRNLIYKMSK